MELRELISNVGGLCFACSNLRESGAKDFLLLFESIQDVAELDSAFTPTCAQIYQIKKKDRNEWSLNNLSGTSVPKASKTKPTPPIKTKVKDSPIGKLYLSLEAFPNLPVEGHFISNAGFDLPLATGGNAATSTPCTLAELAPQHVAQLTEALKLLCGTEAQPPDLKRLNLKKVPLHPDSPNSYVIHVALDFLKKRSRACWPSCVIRRISGDSCFPAWKTYRRMCVF